jgi:aryl-alcohol dehydrogenase-like predicted oxidoreductase
VLTGKYKPGQEPPPGSRASGGESASIIERWMRDDVLHAVQRLAPIARDMDLTLSQLAIAWVLTNPNVAAAIIGASRPEQIDENVKAAGITLPDDVMSAIDYALGDLVINDPSLTKSPNPRP